MPIGVDTMVFININGQEVCARSSPRAVAPVGSQMEFTVQLNQMHLVDPVSDRVI